MGEKVPKKMNLKEIGIEKIILIAIAGIVLLLANFSEWKNAISEKTEKKEVVEEVKNTVKNHKISGITLEIFETSITVADLEAAVKKDAEAKGLKGKELHIYVNAEERAAYYTADGEGSDDYKIDLTTL